MKRIYLFEIEDFPWCPQFIRDGITDYLNYAIKFFNIYKPAVPLLKKIIESEKCYKIIDICSGGGGGIEDIINRLNESGLENINAVVTDKFPNLAAFKFLKNKNGGRINYYSGSVDAKHVPENLKGIRTLFSSFHHFDQSSAKEIIEDSVKNNAPIAIFEGANRSLINIFGVLLTTPILMFFFTPFIKPFRIKRIIFTYLIPVIPLICTFDGIISILRIYKPNELLSLTNEMKENSCYWKSGEKKNKILKMTYFIGIPNKKAPQ